jgi:hypothetical protein
MLTILLLFGAAIVSVVICALLDSYGEDWFIVNRPEEKD